MTVDPARLDWNKGEGLLPAVVQHWRSGAVLMQGWMNEAALRATLDSGKVTFYSRSKQRLWTKGETSQHFLLLREAMTDCDSDSLLLRAEPLGPTCHLGSDSCFGADAVRVAGFLGELDALVAARERERPAGSYTTTLFEAGLRRMAQKVGEEGVETALAAVAQDESALIGEAADLLFHLTVLLRARGLSLNDAIGELERRHR
jgi:phosphoribosyl-AMP cyclohydrolase / phosphoribosyl-ATP pyrophosphohydrolase